MGWLSLRGHALRVRNWVMAGGVALALAACGGGAEPGPFVQKRQASSAEAPNPALGDGPFQTVLQPVPPQLGTGGGGGAATTLTIHYQRSDGNTSGWQLHSWGAAADPGWNQGHNPVGQDGFGAVYELPLLAGSGAVGYLFHKGDDKDHGGADQSWTLKPGKNEIWRRQGDATTYTSPPAGPSQPPDLHTVRVHYKRFDGAYNAWGLHLWPWNGMDVARLPASMVINQWNAAVGIDQMPGYAAGSGEVVFDIPVLNPRQDASREALEFIIHGKTPNENDKDGRPDNIRVAYAGLRAVDGVASIWLVQGDATVYTAAPDLRRVSSTDARAYWLDAQRIQWPAHDGRGTVKIHYSASGQLVAVKDEPVRGSDASVALEADSSPLPQAVAERFGWIGAGARYRLPDAILPSLWIGLQGQLLIVEEDAQGRVQNATSLQTPGAIDSLYAQAGQLNDLGAQVNAQGARWRLWAPTAQRVTVYVYPGATAPAAQAIAAQFDPATGSWVAEAAGDLRGQFYRYGVEVFVRGVGLVRNLVTDPYSVSLSADGRRSALVDLNEARSQPPGWAGSKPPQTVAAAPDMSIYELHVRDFSASDASVPAALRGKFAAFGERSSAGMKHLKALADAGLTDVHLLPIYDFSSVPETGCSTPAPSGGAADETQQALVAATQAGDCFNWGYDPQHFNAPEGSYSSDANDPYARVREFRSLVQGLHQVGLRVGMDVVFNHTSASGQNERSVLDRIVPGYYHRLNAEGGIERSTCCENTATEQLMMAKLMSDSVLLWAREYQISSFRFDLMGHQPLAAMTAIRARLKAELGREVQLLGEGWNFGEVADNRRFVQASQLNLAGSGIGSFNDRLRDAVRGSSFGEGDSFVGNQGFVNGAFYDPNPKGGGKTRGDLLWAGDLIKAGLAGSVRSYELQTHWDARQRLDQLGNQVVGYVAEPGEVINYVENHDNHTLFDLNAFRLPPGTSREDRARVQILAAALNTFAQGVPYFHAGVDTLRSKSLDRNSYDAGDWFNRLDWSYSDNFFATGLPLKGENQANWAVARPLLQDAGIKPTSAEIAWTRDAFRDLLKIRASTTLLRLRTAADIQERLRFHNTGSAQVPTVIAASIDGADYPGARYAELLYFVNVDKQPQQLQLDAFKGKQLQLHPVQLAAAAADARVRQGARFDAASGRFTLPARSAVVFVRH